MRGLSIIGLLQMALHAIDPFNEPLGTAVIDFYLSFGRKK